MINQQLLDFIKLQLSKGLDKETITKELLGGGWAEADIQEGFNTVNIPVVNQTINPVINNPVVSSINNPILTHVPNHSGKKVAFIIVALFVIAGGASGYFFRNDIPVIKDLIKSKNIVSINEIKQEENTQSQIQKEEQPLVQIGQKNETVAVKIEQKPKASAKETGKVITGLDTRIINNVSPKNNSSITSNQQTDCSKIIDQQSKFICVLTNNRTTGDYKTCDQFDGVHDDKIGDYKDQCYYDVSLQTKNIALCDVIVDQKTKDECLYGNAKDESVCKIIKTPSSLARCLEKFNSSKISSQLCDSIDKKYNGGYDYNYCYYFIMKQNYDYNICKKMTDTDTMNSCFHDVATKKLDLKICDMISVDTGSNGRNWCIVVIGRLTNNKTLCNLITGKEEIASCEANI